MMPSARQLVIEPLDPSKHDREGFDCGVAELNEYLKRYARKQVASRIAACYVACPADNPYRIAGYYTLSACTVVRAELKSDIIKGLPAYKELPATLLGRLARSVEFKGEGLGDQLMMSAFHRAHAVTKEVASWAMVTDPKDEHAVSFYRDFGFQPLNKQRLFLSMKSIAKLLNAR